MSERKGSISVKTQDILPIIQKWLYSEHDIFLRELIANATDAITKRGTLGRMENLEVEAPGITVTVNKAEGTLTITDNGVGMTEAEVEKYITQLAFSGAQDFAKTLESQGSKSPDEIIGRFGLGFYSAFMVADQVDLYTLSMQPGCKAVHWSSDGSEEYKIDGTEKTDVGTKIVLHLKADSVEFLETFKVRETLKNHCQFLPYPISLVEVPAKEDAKPDQINNTDPLWKKDPTNLKDEDYIKFYHELFPYDADPLFWIHLNVDHPFTMQGILYFPKVNLDKPVREQNIKLFCKQVFVSDNVKNVIPEFLGLLKGAIDSTDIPLNVSRSSLQGDPNIKKISNYIVKKVAESLKKLFLNDRPRYEQIWEDIGLFVKYGIVSDNKFDELMRDYVLLKNTSGKLVTLDEDVASVPETLKEKLKGKILYCEKGKADLSLRQQLLKEGVEVVELDEVIDPHFMQHVDYHKLGEKELKFASMDSEFENILGSEATTADDMKIKDLFSKYLETDKNPDEKLLEIEVKGLKNATAPAYIKIDESMKRFQKMAQSMGNKGMAFPLKKTLVVNPTNPLIQTTLKLSEKGDQVGLVKELCHHIQDLAVLSSENLGPEEREAFVSRSQNLIQELGQFAVRP